MSLRMIEIFLEGSGGELVKEVLKPTTGSEIYEMIRRACALARDGVPGPVFVEVPAETFAPVKTIFDLLRPEHQV